jgi:hypothetical protein
VGNAGQYFLATGNKGILLLFCEWISPLESGAPDREMIPHPEIADKLA